MENRFRHKVISFAGALSFSIALLSCGIDTLSYLKSDYLPQSISISSKALVFSGPDLTSGYYIGISIYYRIYATSDAAETDKNYITTKQNVDNAVPGELVSSYLTSGLNYRSARFNNTQNEPLLPDSLICSPDPGIEPPKLLSINFNVSEPVLTINDGSIESAYSFERSITDGTNYLSFSTEPESGDDDFKTSTTDPDSEYYVQFYAYSYGLDGLTPVYSDAVWLGLITLYF